MTAIHPVTRGRARQLRAEMTPQERQVWAALRALNRALGWHFRRQAPLGPWIADFADLGRRIVIEIDGQGHGGPDDAARDSWLSGQGFRVLRFCNGDVDADLEGVMQRVLDVAGVAPSPPRRDEGGADPRRGVSGGEGGAPPPPPSPTRGEGGADRGGVGASSGSFPAGRGADLRPGAADGDPGASPPPCGEGMGVGGAGPEGSGR